MYSNGYSQVSRSSPQAQKKMQYRSKGKSCSYYMRIVFFFSSLIQSLIIVSLVLFLVYGKPLDSASTSRIHDLEESFSRLSIENVALRHQRKNLTNLLNITLIEKARNDWDLGRLRYFTNISVNLIQDIDKKLQQCTSKLFFCESKTSYSANCPTTFNLQTQDRCNCGLLAERMKARLELVESNFTQTSQRMRIEMDQTAKERDNINLEVIRLRRDKSTHEKEAEFFRQKCKDDFSQSLSGIANVSKAFLDKIESLFPSHIPFQLTCVKQREHLEQIRTNCTSLSLEVEDRLQRYLNSVGGQVSTIQAENSRVKAENWRLSEDYRWCSNNRTGLILQNRQNVDKLQRKHDEEKERLLMDKMRLNGEIEVLTNSVKYKSRAIDHLMEQNRQLNMSCMSKTGFGGFSQSQPGWGLNGGGSSSVSSGLGQLGRTGSGGLSPSFGSFGSPFNKPALPGAGSSSTLFNSGSSSSIGSGFNKPASSGTGSSTSLFNSGSSSSIGSAFNKPVSSGSSSSIGSAFNKPASTGTGSSSTSLFNSGSSSSIGSAFNKPASSGSSSSIGSAFNKPASSGSSSSIGSAFNKPASSGSSSSIGSAFNKPALSGTGSSSTSLFNSGSSSSSGSVFNKPASSGSSSTIGSALNKPASTGTGSGSSGIGSNKPTTNVKSTSAVGSSSGSTTNKSGSSSSGFSWFGLGSSSSGSKSGSGTGKGPSPGSSYGGAGSSFGAGRTSGFGGGTTSVAQHLRDLQRLINPSTPEENQDLSRMLG